MQTQAELRPCATMPPEGKAQHQPRRAPSRDSSYDLLTTISRKVGPARDPVNTRSGYAV